VAQAKADAPAGMPSGSWCDRRRRDTSRNHHPSSLGHLSNSESSEV